jgi:hypothetical protein
MDITLISESGFEFSQATERLMNPKLDYHMVKEAPPPGQWHFTGAHAYNG